MFHVHINEQAGSGIRMDKLTPDSLGKGLPIDIENNVFPYLLEFLPIGNGIVYHNHIYSTNWFLAKVSSTDMRTVQFLLPTFKAVASCLGCSSSGE